jgi:prevent-host-death family protein
MSFWHNKRVLVTGGNGFLGEPCASRRILLRQSFDRLDAMMGEARVKIRGLGEIK